MDMNDDARIAKMDRLKFNLAMAEKELKLAHEGRAKTQIELEKSWAESKRLISALGQSELTTLRQVMFRLQREIDTENTDSARVFGDCLFVIQRMIDELVSANEAAGEF